jgi:hypothetical protein
MSFPLKWHPKTNLKKKASTLTTLTLALNARIRGYDTKSSLELISPWKKAIEYVRTAVR